MGNKGRKKDWEKEEEKEKTESKEKAERNMERLGEKEGGGHHSLSAVVALALLMYLHSC